jgi:hypothetical protein
MPKRALNILDAIKDRKIFARHFRSKTWDACASCTMPIGSRSRAKAFVKPPPNVKGLTATAPTDLMRNRHEINRSIRHLRISKAFSSTARKASAALPWFWFRFDATGQAVRERFDPRQCPRTPTHATEPVAAAVKGQ